MAPILILDGRAVSCRVSNDNLSVHRVMAMAIRESSYDGSPESRILHIKLETMKLIPHLTAESQYRSSSVRDMLMRPLGRERSRVNVLCMVAEVAEYSSQKHQVTPNRHSQADYQTESGRLSRQRHRLRLVGYDGVREYDKA